GALFARRIFGDVELYLTALHEDLRNLESMAASSPEEGALLEPAVTALRAKLAEDLRGAEGLKETEDGGAETLVFYQSSDGQLIFLEPHLMKQLLSSYSTWARLPPSVLLKPLKSMRQEALTDEMKKRQMDRMDLPGEWVTDDGFEVHRFLQHLPSDAAGNLIAFADGEVLAGDEGKSNGKGRKGKGRRKPREPRDGAGRERLESQESKASASFSGADGHTGSEPLASPSLAPEPEPAQEDAWSEPEKAEVAALDGPELLNDADA
ncbi:unnamed protein product, partial [Durusdinium trenchii]